jgi:carboxylate-amine ligase
MSSVTVGVEEEFLLLDPDSGAAIPAAPLLLRRLAGVPGPRAELMRYQIETATSVCTGLGELRDQLVGLRRLVGGAAERAGCRLVASGTAPYGTPGVTALSAGARYREVARRFPALVDTTTCGCHVHVGVPSRDLGVQVLAWLRPWLATLLAVSANSPIADGRVTGWASRRYPVWVRWPSARPPRVWPDADRYDATVRRLIRGGAALDERGVYFLARLSPRYPTVEFRVADTCLDVDTAVLLAALARGLVVTAMSEIAQGARLPPDRSTAIKAGLLAAARHGLDDAGVDPVTGQVVTQRTLLDRLLDRIGGALETVGDAEAVAGLLRRLAERGTGADRQSSGWVRARSPAEFVGLLANITVYGVEPVLVDCRWP